MATMDMPRARTGWRFWLEWMGMNLAALVVYVVAMIPLSAALAVPGPAFPAERGYPWLGQFIMSAGSILLGLALGIAQWLVLRKHLKRIGGWLLATTVGYALPFIVVFPLGFPVTEPIWLAGVLMLLWFGVLLGVLQWLVLRNRLEHAGWWIPISIGGWLLAFVLTGAAYVTNVYVEPFDLFAAAFVPIAVAGAGLAGMVNRQIVT